MTIPVTTRGGKGSALTQSEADTNFTNLARDASTTVQGNTRLATLAEHAAGTSQALAATPAGVAQQVATIQGLGDGQTWADLSGSRVEETDYTNNTGRTMVVSISANITANGIVEGYVDGIKVANLGNPFGDRAVSINMTLIVPDGSVYKITSPIGTATVNAWGELS